MPSISGIGSYNAPSQHFEGLPFRVSATTSLKVAGRVSNMLMLTESGQMGPQGPDAALFVVGSSLAQVDVSDLKAFAKVRASQTKQLQGLRVSAEGATTVGNEAAYEIVAEGTDIATGRISPARSASAAFPPGPRVW